VPIDSHARFRVEVTHFTGLPGLGRMPSNWTLASKDFQDDRRDRLWDFVPAAIRSTVVRIVVKAADFSGSCPLKPPGTVAGVHSERCSPPQPSLRLDPFSPRGVRVLLPSELAGVLSDDGIPAAIIATGESSRGQAPDRRLRINTVTHILWV
jgi:hypothetical protein